MLFRESCFTNEAELIKACIANDKRAQRIMYEKFSSRMFSLCLRYSKDRALAEDLLQDGFITVFLKLKSYNGNGSFEGWMRKIFVNTALMQIRKNDVLKDSTDVDILSYSTPFNDNILEKIDGKDVINMIMEMPEGFRTVFNLSVFEGFSHQEIAQNLGITEGTSRSQLNRARQWLQKRIIENEGER